MKDHSTRPTLSSFLAASGISPETFFQAIDILLEEERKSLEGGAAPAPPPPAMMPPQDRGAENDAIRRILIDISARWKREDRAKREERPESTLPWPSSPGGDAGGIRVETVVLKGAAADNASPKIEPTSPSAPEGQPAATLRREPTPSTPFPDDMPTIILRSGPPPASMPAAAGESLRAGPGNRMERLPETAEDQPTTFLQVGRPAGLAQPHSPVPPVETAGEDDLAKTVILRPDRLKGKGKEKEKEKGGPE